MLLGLDDYDNMEGKGILDESLPSTNLYHEYPNNALLRFSPILSKLNRVDGTVGSLG